MGEAFTCQRVFRACRLLLLFVSDVGVGEVELNLVIGTLDVVVVCALVTVIIAVEGALLDHIREIGSICVQNAPTARGRPPSGGTPVS